LYGSFVVNWRNKDTFVGNEERRPTMKMSLSDVIKRCHHACGGEHEESFCQAQIFYPSTQKSLSKYTRS
jgi:hypothetical protein